MVRVFEVKEDITPLVTRLNRTPELVMPKVITLPTVNSVASSKAVIALKALSQVSPFKVRTNVVPDGLVTVML